LNYAGRSPAIAAGYGDRRFCVAKAGQTFPTLATKRLRLRQFEARDLQGLHACFGDQDAMRYWNFPACKTEAETEPKLHYLAKTSSPYDYLAWAVADKRSDRCIGLVNYHHREARNEKLEIGYILAPAQQGRGLMTEAVAALVAYCFGELSAHRIEALIHPDNVRLDPAGGAPRLSLRGRPPARPLARRRALHERHDVCSHRRVGRRLHSPLSQDERLEHARSRAYSGDRRTKAIAGALKPSIHAHQHSDREQDMSPLATYPPKPRVALSIGVIGHRPDRLPESGAKRRRRRDRACARFDRGQGIGQPQRRAVARDLQRCRTISQDRERAGRRCGPNGGASRDGASNDARRRAAVHGKPNTPAIFRPTRRRQSSTSFLAVHSRSSCCQGIATTRAGPTRRQG
jgi:ribosomal-protein-alanine N-acetyltransferase